MNVALTEQFYPEDIPEDWLLDYYSNEFRVILLQPQDICCLNDTAGALEERKTVDWLAELDEINEDLGREDFVIVIDISEYPVDQQNALREYTDRIDNCFSGIDSTTLLPLDSQRLGVSGQWGGSHNQKGRQLFYLLSEPREIEPVSLKELIAHIRHHAAEIGAASADVLFASDVSALNNCRNAIVLDSMM